MVTTPQQNGASSLDPTPLVSLDALDMAALSTFSPAQLAALAQRLAALQSAIAIAMFQHAIITRTVTPAPPPAPASDGATRLLDASAIAQRTGLARSYVYELIRSGSLRAVKVGKYRRVTESALAEWIVRHETQAR